MDITNNLLQNRNVMLLNTNIDQEIIKKNVPNDLVEEMFNQVIDLNINGRQPAQISPIEDIVAEMKAGRMVILIDEEDRENEGDLVISADHVTPEAINFMAKHGRGLICLTLTRDRCNYLNLPPMAAQNGATHGTAFTVSIEAAHGVTTGISASDRARTIKAAIASDAKPSDLVQPGHIFPLQAVEGGVLKRAGHTEAGCDLALMAECSPSAVICEIMNDDGTMARLDDLKVFAAEHDLKIGTISDLIAYRSRTESLVKKIGERKLDTKYGQFTANIYKNSIDDTLSVALIKGSITESSEVLVRVHEPTSIFDFLDVNQSNKSWGIDAALHCINEEGCGVMVFLNCTNVSDQLFKELDAEQFESDNSNDRKPIDMRSYGIGAQILRNCGVKKIRVMGVPRRMPSMIGYDLEIVGYVSRH
jgi:3,4-dihydroxy 2-butanone 4-phosphate synthase/GTP cyclohydrolase II